jgi:hypothetical protein
VPGWRVSHNRESGATIVSVNLRSPGRPQSNRRLGSAAVEFVLVGAFFFTPVILGLMSVGFTLTRALQTANLTRDVGRMFVRGVDFSVQSNQDLVTGSPSKPNMPVLARGLGMQGNGGNATGGTSGNGVLVLSIMTKVSSSCGCNNAGHIVLSRRIVVGNKTLFASSYGNPTGSLINQTTGAISNYTNEITARADSFSGIITLSSGELAYMVETKFVFPDLAINGVFPSPAVFWRSVF